MPLDFVFDEQLRGPLWQAVLRHNLAGIDPLNVVRVGDLEELPLGATDPAILQWAQLHDRLLVTEDRQTMAAHLTAHLASGQSSPGVLMNRRRHRLRFLVECSVLVAYAGEPREFANQVTFLP